MKKIVIIAAVLGVMLWAAVQAQAATISGTLEPYGVRDFDVPVGSTVELTKGASKADVIFTDEDTILVRSYCRCKVKFEVEVSP